MGSLQQKSTPQKLPRWYENLKITHPRGVFSLLYFERIRSRKHIHCVFGAIGRREHINRDFTIHNKNFAISLVLYQLARIQKQNINIIFQIFTPLRHRCFR
jgi:hypothetical protein